MAKNQGLSLPEGWRHCAGAPPASHKGLPYEWPKEFTLAMMEPAIFIVLRYAPRMKDWNEGLEKDSFGQLDFHEFGEEAIDQKNDHRSYDHGG